MKKWIILILTILLLLMSRAYLNKKRYVQSVIEYNNMRVDSFKNELDQMEYRIHAKDQTLDNLRKINGKKYYELKKDLKVRDIKIKNLVSLTEFQAKFGGKITIENTFKQDTMYLYLPIDDIVKFDDGYLSADLMVENQKLVLPYTYKPGDIFIDQYYKRPGFLKSKQLMTSIRFQNPNVDVVNTDVVVNQPELKFVMGIGGGGSVISHDGQIFLKPSLGIYALYPLIKIQR